MHGCAFLNRPPSTQHRRFVSHEAQIGQEFATLHSQGPTRERSIAHYRKSSFVRDERAAYATWSDQPNQSGIAWKSRMPRSITGSGRKRYQCVSTSAFTKASVLGPSSE